MDFGEIARRHGANRQNSRNNNTNNNSARSQQLSSNTLDEDSDNSIPALISESSDEEIYETELEVIAARTQQARELREVQDRETRNAVLDGGLLDDSMLPNSSPTGDENLDLGLTWSTLMAMSISVSATLRLERADTERAGKLVDALEVVPVSLLKRLESVTTQEDTMCAICWESLLEDAGFSSDPSSHSNVVSLPCAHIFHSLCLISWFSNRSTCPTCRFDLDPQRLTLSQRPFRSVQTNGPMTDPNPLPQIRPAAGNLLDSPPGGQQLRQEDENDMPDMWDASESVERDEEEWGDLVSGDNEASDDMIGDEPLMNAASLSSHRLEDPISTAPQHVQILARDPEHATPQWENSASHVQAPQVQTFQHAEEWVLPQPPYLTLTEKIEKMERDKLMIRNE